MAPKFDLVELFSGAGNVGKVWRLAKDDTQSYVL